VHRAVTKPSNLLTFCLINKNLTISPSQAAAAAAAALNF